MERPVHLTCTVRDTEKSAVEKSVVGADLQVGPAPSRYLKTGDTVRVRDDRWRVLHVAAHDGCAIVELAGSGEANRGTTARFILPFETTDPLRPSDAAPKRVRAVIARSVARRVLSTAAPAWTSLKAAAAARVTLLPYQLEPALAMTRGLSCRFLLADAVGLGKTIQAGFLIAELLSRDRNARILVVTPAGLREQWREELRDRFDIHPEVLDAPALARATATLPTGVNPWSVPQVILTSIDFVKRPDVIRSLEPIVWDLVAFDEAHALAGRSDRAIAAELLARRGRRVVAITATPHSGDPRDYERLRSLGSLGPDDPILVFRRSREEAGLARRRVTRLHRIRPTPEERALHNALDGYARRVWRDAPTHTAPAARLAMLVLARRAASSAASLARSVERRLLLLDARRPETSFQLTLPLGDDTIRDDEAPGEELAAPGLPDVDLERRWLERIHGLAQVAMTRESKIRAIERLLRLGSEPAIVFTEYRDTLERVASVLAPQHASRFARLHGGMTAAERNEEARRFTHGDAQLLLATDAASEGLNLHRRCRLVINLEVPWTPLRLEQRIGRVDRLGQERRVHAIGLIGRDTAEESVVAALMARAATAEREAPFGGANLRVEAEAEALRLEKCRALARTTVRASECRRIRREGRPVICLLARGRPHFYAAVRLPFVDAAGFELWDTIIGAHLPKGFFPDMLSSAMTSVVATSDLHDAILNHLRDDLRAATQPLIAREEAMLVALHARSGRLAAPLVQPGLFDRRARRDAEAQRRIAAEAATAAAERIVALRRMMDPATGRCHVVFALAARGERDTGCETRSRISIETPR